MKNIKNYTSKVPVSQSLVKIEEELVSIGANRIVKEYDADRRLASIAFSYRLGDVDVPLTPPNGNSSAPRRNVPPGRTSMTGCARKWC